MKIISQIFIGLLFGIGLLISGMSDPSKVIGFLDIFGAWDPSLVLVMAGAIGVALLPFAYAKKRSTSLLGEPMQLPPQNGRIDQRLIIGSIIFGAGWGLAGFCPGPALVTAAAGEPKAWVFVIAMLVGMWVFEMFGKKRG